MIKSIKIRLIPTKEQEIFNNTIKKQDEYKWIKEISVQTTAKVFDDLNEAFNNFFNKRAKYPRFKSKKKSRQSFYVRYDAIKFEDGKVNLEKIGKVKYKTNYKIPTLDKYVNPRCSFDGKYWYLSLGFEYDENQVMLNNDLSVGIDLGIKNLAIVSHMDKPIKNINKIAKAIQEQCLYEFIRQMKYKCEFNKIEFIQVPRNFPSSKQCSCCGEIKKDLKLKDRVYVCDKCNLIIDRDKNASINLSNYNVKLA